MDDSTGLRLLTKEECLQIIKNDLTLKDFNNIELKSYKIKKCSSDLVRFMGAYYRLEVEIKEKNLDKTRQLTYFVKSLPLDNEIYRNECERKGFFTKESQIYQNILPNIQRYSTKPLYPKSYLTRKDLIVMEDFSLPEKKLKQLEENESFTLKHYQVFLQHLAEFHASSLAWEIKESINIGKQFEGVLYELLLTTNNTVLQNRKKIIYLSIIHLARQHPKYQYPEALEFINQKLYNIFLNMEDLTKPSTTLRNVLCHRDSWDRNIFWEYSDAKKPISCRIVDFQLTRYSPPAIDVLSFLYINFESAEKRSNHLQDLLLYYYDCLKASFKAKNLSEYMITKSDFDKDCHRALLAVLTKKAICEPIFKLPKGWSQTMREKEPDKFDYYINTERSEMFLRVSQIDASYMDRILQPVQEIMEYFGFEAQ